MRFDIFLHIRDLPAVFDSLVSFPTVVQSIRRMKTSTALFEGEREGSFIGKVWRIRKKSSGKEKKFPEFVRSASTALRLLGIATVPVCR